jgi:hypothetical protein
MPNPERDEAIVSAYSILSLLHHRGLVDSKPNREDVEAAMNKLQPFSKKAEARMMR